MKNHTSEKKMMLNITNAHIVKQNVKLNGLRMNVVEQSDLTAELSRRRFKPQKLKETTMPDKQEKPKYADSPSVGLSDLLAADAINIYYDTKGTVKKIPFEGNAVIVHLFPDVDYNGNQIFKRIVTIALEDNEMLEPLKQEAYRILGG